MSLGSCCEFVKLNMPLIPPSLQPLSLEILIKHSLGKHLECEWCYKNLQSRLLALWIWLSSLQKGHFWHVFASNVYLLPPGMWAVQLIKSGHNMCSSREIAVLTVLRYLIKI